MGESEKVSKFSSGLNIITRLDILWRNCQNFKRKGQYCSWNDELDTIWLELARDLNEKEYEDEKKEDGNIIKGYKSRFEDFELRLKETLPFNDSINGFKRPSKEIFERRNRQYKILMEKQIFLARLENKLDKGTTYVEEDDEF